MVFSSGDRLLVTRTVASTNGPYSTKRKAAVESLVASVGGSVEACYFAFGDVDLFVIMDVPDPAGAAAVSLAANASGAVAITATALLRAEDMDAAARLIPGYRPPGS